MTTVLFIGRFQPFHTGHLLALKEIAPKHDKVIIGVGSSNKCHTLRNPFTFEERKEMIAAALDAEQMHCELYPIPDTGDNKLWVQQILKNLPKFDKVYSNSPWTRECLSSANIEVQGTGTFEPYDASLIREKIGSGEEWQNLVPAAVAEYLIKINAPSRIKELAHG
jgi:nicotinamide-nucleotide adenylyltransferase